MTKQQKKKSVLGGLAVAWIMAANLGCGLGGSTTDWSWGCLEAADVDGTPAQAHTIEGAGMTEVRLDASGPAARGDVVSLHGAALAELEPGVYRAADEGLLEDGAPDISIERCDADATCRPVSDVTLEIVELGNGTVRAQYTGMVADAAGGVTSIEGSFTYPHGVDPRGI